jgi:acyl dehydratase
VGDTLAERVTVASRDPARQMLTLTCSCTNQDGVTVIDGEATVLAPAERIERPAIVLPQVHLSTRGAAP